MNRPRVTVVIPFYNDPYVAEAIESVLAQTHEGIELIVVNDGSTREAERLAPYVNRVHILGKANGGTASALNHGIRMASGEYVAWLSSDDRFLPAKIESQLRHMEQTGSAISHTAFRVIDDSGGRKEKPVRLHFESMYLFYESFLKGNAVNGCTVMMRKSLFDKLGGFNEKLPFTHDYDFWLRAILAGYPLAYLDEVLTEYRHHEGMGTVKHRGAIESEFQAVAEGYRNRVEHLLKALAPPPWKADSNRRLGGG
ncbi:glycosyltransferase family 2 protein [Cohnella fermenti]|uniref:Glycosyltransferase n=1 Tax=Cohnella fermenti TaxID=2565925 RepID=A0A4S4BG52_9BACL|nr:glycosyltransferase [Cohnella fermenti]THF73368.1 glycosyltransferase [Cohnella fermenti]